MLQGARWHAGVNMMDAPETPPIEEWSRLSVTCQRLQNLSGAQFEQLCYALLLKRGLRLSEHSRLIPGGLTYTRALTPRPGPVDAALATPTGPTMLAGFGVIPASDKKSWQRKLASDFEKIREVVHAKGLIDVSFLFMTTADLQPEEVLSAQQELADEHILTKVEINPLKTIGLELAVTHVDLADRFLRIPIPLQRFVRLDFGTADSRRDLALPCRTDFESGLVCLPGVYQHAVRSQLEASRRCVVWGPPSSGKTWLAAAYCSWSEHKFGDPAYYVDARACQPGDGRVWYTEAVRWNTSAPIVVIDNCQVEPEEVDEFCTRFDSTPEVVSRTSVILLVTQISTPTRLRAETPSAQWLRQYGVQMNPEQVWEQIVRTYGQFLRSQDEHKYADIGEDLRQNRATIESRHAYDLAASRARLETWEQTGGRLSEVADEAFYDYLEQRYVRGAPELMNAVCALWSYEVPTHQRFFDAHPNRQRSAEQLVDIGLLVEDSGARSIYGRCLRPSFHRNLAQEIFKAWVRRDNPTIATTPEPLVRRRAAIVREYFLAAPLNAAKVYRALYQGGDNDIIATLVKDTDVVLAVRSILSECPGPDVSLLLVCLQRHVPGRVSEILDELREEQAQKSLADRLQRVPIVVISASVAALRKLDDELSTSVVRRFAPSELAKKLLMASIQTVGTCLTMLTRTGYPDNKITELLSGLDPVTLGSRDYEGGLQSLVWVARSLDRSRRGGLRKREGPGQDFMRKLGGQRLATAWRKRPVLEVLQLFFEHSARDVRELLMKELSDDELCDVLNNSDLKEFANIMHWHPVLRRGYQKLRDSGQLRAKLNEASAAEIGLCLHVCRQPYNSPQVAREVLRELLAGGGHERFLEGEDLLALALLLYHAGQIDIDSARKIAVVLEDTDRVRTALIFSSLNGIQLLIYNLGQLRQEKNQPMPAERRLAQELASVDLSNPIENATVRVIDHFVWNIHELVDKKVARSFCSYFLNKVAHEMETLSLDDVSRAIWTLVKVMDTEISFVGSLLGELKVKVESADPPAVSGLLTLVGCLELVGPGITTGWKLVNVDEISIREIALTRLSGPTPQPVTVALMVIGLTRAIGHRRSRTVFHNAGHNLIEKALTSAIPEVSTARARGALETAVQLLHQHQ